MNQILLFTSVMMWALAVGATIILLKLLKETDRLRDELEEQREELETVAVAVATYVLQRRNQRSSKEDDEGKGEGENSDI